MCCLSEATTLWDGYEGTKGVLEGRDRDVARLRGREPDLVVCSNTYWALNGFVSRDPDAKLVHAGYLSEYASAMHALVGAVREAFPRSKVGLRTSHQVRSDCTDANVTESDCLAMRAIMRRGSSRGGAHSWDHQGERTGGNRALSRRW
jgi:hypothetical protein